MSLKTKGSLEDTLDVFLDPAYDPLTALQATLKQTAASTSDLGALHAASAELMAALDTWSAQLFSQLTAELAVLEKSEKRISFDINMFSNDLARFGTEESQVASAVQKLLAPINASESSKTLRELLLIKERILQVKLVLKQASETDFENEAAEIANLLSQHKKANAQERLEKLKSINEVFSGTSLESTNTNIIESARKQLAGEPAAEVTAGYWSMY